MGDTLPRGGLPSWPSGWNSGNSSGLVFECVRQEQPMARPAASATRAAAAMTIGMTVCRGRDGAGAGMAGKVRVGVGVKGGLEALGAGACGEGSAGGASGRRG